MNRINDSMPHLLPARAVLEISGAEARDYLQSLVTNDAGRLKAGQAMWAGLLTPQGKILFDFFILDAAGERFLLDVAADMRDALAQRLAMYKLRRAVEIAPRDDLAVAAGAPEGALAVFDDPRLAAMGRRAIIPAERAEGLLGGAAAYETRRISLGLPDSDADIGSGKLFPHEANFDQLNGVSFTKGCYVGQEVVSRMQHRGTARNRLLPVSAEAPLTPRMKITGADKPIGEVTSASGGRAIALIRLDRAAAAIDAGAPLLAGDIPVRLVRPEWARFDVPGA